MFIATGFLPAAPGGRPVVWAATGRSGGRSRPPYDGLNLASNVGDDASDVEWNRQEVRSALGAHELAVTTSAHGNAGHWVDNSVVPPGCDAVLTARPGLALAALGADCCVVCLVGASAIAVVHCGWRGLVCDVIGASVRSLMATGPVHAAVLGPAICGACYPVPPERAAEVEASPGGGTGVIVRCADGQPGVDVRAGVRARLAELGLAGGSITLAGGCTRESAGLFSHRRDGTTGRHGLAAMILPGVSP